MKGNENNDTIAEQVVDVAERMVDVVDKDIFLRRCIGISLVISSIFFSISFGLVVGTQYYTDHIEHKKFHKMENNASN